MTRRRDREPHPLMKPMGSELRAQASVVFSAAELAQLDDEQRDALLRGVGKIIGAAGEEPS